MQDTFFLLKNWLPVGISAIVFFAIGLLLAKFIWGRFNQRLSNAVEENINLASQWSALGASQQDLFKKLRVRWQADRDAWESAIAEKEARITLLSGQLTSSGKELPPIPTEDAAAKAKIRELESSLAARTQELEDLRAELAAKSAENGEQKGAKALPSPPLFELQARLRDLEQDLIDTHDELHTVRADYDKQAVLVETLEARLIAAPTSEEQRSGGDAASAESRQAEALLRQRGREVRAMRLRVAESKAESKAEYRDRLAMANAAHEEERERFEERFSALEREKAKLSAERAEAEGRRDELLEQADLRQKAIDSLEEELRVTADGLADANAKIAELEILARRKATLQAELNDACHELYDVRRALNLRAERVEAVEARLAELKEVESENAGLQAELSAKRDELDSLSRVLEAARVNFEEATSQLSTLSKQHRETVAEKAALEAQLDEVRRDLSETRLSLGEKSAEHQRAAAQMEELEAIIEDRGAEVNDLAAELRQQRDLVRQLKDSLAETKGEMEALSDESRSLALAARARDGFNEEQGRRIAELEKALADRYRELNRVRVEAEEQAVKARHYESRAVQIEDELVRRGVEFDASDRRIADTEAALEMANARIAALTEELRSSEVAISELREDVARVSREKDENLRELDRATRRIEQLEEAARQRETQILEIERELFDRRNAESSLELKAERLQLELENAREEQRVTQVGVAELEEALRAGDERILQLSSRLDEKENEAIHLNAELSGLRDLVDARSASEAEAKIRLATLESEYEALRRQQVPDEERAAHAEEVSDLRGEIAELTARLSSESGQRASSLGEIEALRAKIAARSEMIRELQNQISGLMLQREGRDTEIAMLKDKLRAVENELSRSASSERLTVVSSESSTLSEAALAAAVANSLGEGDDEGTSLDEIAVEIAAPSGASVGVAPESVAAPKSGGGTEDDQTVYFAKNDAALGEGEVEKIDLCARSIRRYGKKVEVTVIGFAGSEGSGDFNESLSARRAEAVRERLLERGVSQAVLKVRGAGQDRRFSDWRARRVELVVSPVAVAEAVN